MPTTYVTGNLFDSNLPAISHGCNAKAVMGAGFALQIQRRYPLVYQSYRAACARGEFVLGSCLPVKEGSVLVYNLCTQPFPGPCATVEAIEESMTKMIRHAEENQVQVVGFPMIGAGLGGLTRESVKQVFEKLGAGTLVQLVCYELPQRSGSK